MSNNDEDILQTEEEIIHQLADELSKLKTINEQIGAAKDAAEQMRQSTEEIIEQVKELIAIGSDTFKRIEQVLQQQIDSCLSEVRQIRQASGTRMGERIDELTERIDKLTESQQKQNAIITQVTCQLESQTKLLEDMQQRGEKKRRRWRLFSSKE